MAYRYQFFFSQTSQSRRVVIKFISSLKKRKGIGTETRVSAKNDVYRKKNNERIKVSPENS